MHRSRNEQKPSAIKRRHSGDHLEALRVSLYRGAVLRSQAVWPLRSDAASVVRAVLQCRSDHVALPLGADSLLLPSCVSSSLASLLWWDLRVRSRCETSPARGSPIGRRKMKLAWHRPAAASNFLAAALDDGKEYEELSLAWLAPGLIILSTHRPCPCVPYSYKRSITRSSSPTCPHCKLVPARPVQGRRSKPLP